MAPAGGKKDMWRSHLLHPIVVRFGYHIALVHRRPSTADIFIIEEAKDFRN